VGIRERPGYYTQHKDGLRLYCAAMPWELLVKVQCRFDYLLKGGAGRAIILKALRAFSAD